MKIFICSKIDDSVNRDPRVKKTISEIKMKISSSLTLTKGSRS